ncbi:MAG: hypothetical protein ABI967_12300 [bacterium]
MSELLIENVDGRKLAHAYVALAMARDLAQRYIDDRSVREDLRPLLTTLDVAAELLEEVMQKALPEPSVAPSLAVLSSENVM